MKEIYNSSKRETKVISGQSGDGADLGKWGCRIRLPSKIKGGVKKIKAFSSSLLIPSSFYRTSLSIYFYCLRRSLFYNIGSCCMAVILLERAYGPIRIWLLILREVCALNNVCTITALCQSKEVIWGTSLSTLLLNVSRLCAYYCYSFSTTGVLCALQILQRWRSLF